MTTTTPPRYPPNVLNPLCTSRLTLELLADKWVLLIVMALADGVKRNGQLKREIGDISQKMLTQTLRDLEQRHIIQRMEYPQVPPKVEYQLTDLGKSLLEPIRALARWAEDHYQETLAATE